MPRPFSKSLGSVVSIATTTYPGSRVNVTEYGPYPFRSVSAYQSSQRTPGFRNLKSYQLPVNTYTTSLIERSYGATYAVRSDLLPDGRPYKIETREGLPWIWYPDVGYGEAVTQLKSSDASRTQDRAISDLLAKLKDMKFNAAQAFAERKQTANLLINSVNRFVEFARNFRRGNLVRCLSLLKSWKKARSKGRKWTDQRWRNLKFKDHNDFGRYWLEYSYGWKPLLGDIHGAAELLAQTYHRETQPARSVGSAKFGDKFSWKHGLCHGYSNINLSYRVFVDYDIDNAALKAGQSTGITDPLLLAWELLPFSFVVDWFIPVGNYLEGINAPAGLRFKRGGITSKVQLYSLGILGGIDSWGFEVTGGYYEYKNFDMSRSPLRSFPTASVPTASLNLNLNQVTSAFALLNQIFNKRR